MGLSDRGMGNRVVLVLQHPDLLGAAANRTGWGPRRERFVKQRPFSAPTAPGARVWEPVAAPRGARSSTKGSRQLLHKLLSSERILSGAEG